MSARRPRRWVRRLAVASSRCSLPPRCGSCTSWSAPDGAGLLGVAGAAARRRPRDAARLGDVGAGCGQPETSPAARRRVLARCCRRAGSRCGSPPRAGSSASVVGFAAGAAHAAVRHRRARAAALRGAQPDRAAHRARAARRRLGRRADPARAVRVAAVDVGRASSRPTWRSSPSPSARCAACQSPPAGAGRADPRARPPAGGARCVAAAAGVACRTCCPRCGSAAATAVVGAVVAEISTGTRGGIGRLIIEYAQAGDAATRRKPWRRRSSARAPCSGLVGRRRCVVACSRLGAAAATDVRGGR